MSMFSIGLSGLNAAQNALNTTSNNIGNVYTPGYNREVTVLGEGRGDGGVRVNDIQRQFNQYVAGQLNASTSTSKALEAYAGQVSQIDNLLADREAGLAPLMQDFFSALEDLAGAPSDPAARQGVLGATDTLTAQFRAFDGYLQDMQDGIDGQIRDEVTQINNLTQQLATFNREIALSRARNGEAPNSLLNQRDHLVNQLNERMDVRLNIQDGKNYNISLPNGQPLVSGVDAYKLETTEAPNDPQRTVLAYRDSGNNLVALDEDTITGGTLGGLMQFRNETLDKTQNQIGQLAVSLAVGFNNQHGLGKDLDGEQGGGFFTIGEPQAYFHADNAGTAEIIDTAFDEARIDALRATDYEIRVENEPAGSEADFTVVRKDSGETVDDVTLDGSTLSFGGITVTFDDLNNLKQNDSFEVQPVRRAAQQMSGAISDLDKIAAGSLVESEGDLAVEAMRADAASLTSGDAPWTLEVTVDNGDGTFDIEVSDKTGSVVSTETVTPGAGADAEVSVDGLHVRLGEDLEVGQTLTLEVAGSGTGDNRNALALQDLQGEALVAGNASLSQAYGGLVSDVGNRTNIVEVNLDARQGLTDQLRAVQLSESGVNLDEEAANLIRYQQFYQANARVIDTATTVFDTILGLRS
ncbi:flagellar hook-associated protein FlgK [Billgrantia azerbaijanica]|nr:flagellar hook-associated protein FlgK [Halomonas azerbaijanica]